MTNLYIMESFVNSHITIFKTILSNTNIDNIIELQSEIHHARYNFNFNPKYTLLGGPRFGVSLYYKTIEFTKNNDRKRISAYDILQSCLIFKDSDKLRHYVVVCEFAYHNFQNNFGQHQYR